MEPYPATVVRRLGRGDAPLDVSHEDWAAAEIRRLTETRLCACEALAEANIALGAPELALAELESLTERSASAKRSRPCCGARWRPLVATST